MAEVIRHAPVPAIGPFASDAGAPETLISILGVACAHGASDVHLQRLGPATQVHLRLDGALVPLVDLPDGLSDRVFGRIKYLARLKTYVESTPQEGRIERGAAGVPDEVRVSTYPTVTGEKIVLRLFATRETRTLEELDLPPKTRDALRKALQNPSGLLLLTGPSGSGKTTTIYACLRELTSQGRHVITVEDPVEQVVTGIMQTEVREEAGLTFSRAARHLLRQDPEVLVIGEIRDSETAQIAMRATLTGHLLIATLHAGSCRTVFERLLLLGVDASSLATTSGLIVNQRLLRRRCRACHGEGCPACLSTGYRGRLPVAEHLVIDEKVRAALRSGSTATLMPEQSLADHVKERIDAGETDFRERERIIGHES